MTSLPASPSEVRSYLARHALYAFPFDIQFRSLVIIQTSLQSLEKHPEERKMNEASLSSDPPGVSCAPSSVITPPFPPTSTPSAVSPTEPRTRRK